MPEPFISREDLSDHMHLPTGSLDEDDAALQAVDAACDWVRDLTGQTFNYATDDVILMDGDGVSEKLLLPEMPVEEVSSVVVAEWAEVEGYTWTIQDDGCLIAQWLPEGATQSYPLVWPRGRNNVEITYTHGFQDADFPRSLRMVALKLASRFYTQTGGVVFESLGQRSVRYETDAGKLETGDRLILRRHTYHRQPSRVVVA